MNEGGGVGEFPHTQISKTHSSTIRAVIALFHNAERAMLVREWNNNCAINFDLCVPLRIHEFPCNILEIKQLT